VPIAGEQLSTAMLDDGKCAIAVVFQLENPVGAIEGCGPLQERHWLKNLHWKCKTEYQNGMNFCVKGRSD
jgi:hypothetical protein